MSRMTDKGGGGFFFQAEDGIRGIGVTGVQTCALPIYTKSMLNNEYYLQSQIKPGQQLGEKLMQCTFSLNTKSKYVIIKFLKKNVRSL